MPIRLDQTFVLFKKFDVWPRLGLNLLKVRPRMIQRSRTRSVTLNSRGLVVRGGTRKFSSAAI